MFVCNSLEHRGQTYTKQFFCYTIAGVYTIQRQKVGVSDCVADVSYVCNKDILCVGTSSSCPYPDAQKYTLSDAHTLRATRVGLNTCVDTV